MKNQCWRWIVGFGGVLALAAFFRGVDLGHSAVRSDEINFLNAIRQDQSVVELWKNPPWFNQIPLADSIPILWARFTRQPPDESVLRQPFACLGILTVLFCAVWVGRRKGIWCGMLMGVWMAVLPYHVYHSREAYYYGLVMFFAAGMTLRGADFAARLSAGGRLKAWEMVEWGGWSVLACLSHMSAWIVAGVVGLWLVVSGWKGAASPAERNRHLMAMAMVGVGLAVGMSRWIWRALHEMQRAASAETTHIGADFHWVAARVVPLYMGGANLMGLLLLVFVCMAALIASWKRKQRRIPRDVLYGTITGLCGACLLASYAYIAGVGGGQAAKWAYFSANGPLLMAWAVMSMDRFWTLWNGRIHAIGMLVTILAVAGVLAYPAWMITRLEGKPTPYRTLQTWLNANLEPGDVALVDRWLEPWNEMALYAPEQVRVHFTVPDEPYEQYVALNWRARTRAAFEQNQAQAFIRLARNHEARMGLWTWPETWFTHRAVVTNTAGLWLRKTGFAPAEDFYFERGRLEVEIFYDTHEDIAERARRNGAAASWFFGGGWRIFKPWQQGDFSDYHILEQDGWMDLYNLTEEEAPMRVEVTGFAINDMARLRVNNEVLLTLQPGRSQTHAFALVLQPGRNRIPWRLQGGKGIPLVQEVRVSVLPQESATAIR
ncbi:MAG: hypothetical protein LBN38_06630 [Verrucomicrobiota bacterium]|jgi:hypothetical protein|nr:hypothetical protein [Verrucomicrobiota bacterium]